MILVAAARGIQKRKSHNLLERNMLCAAELWVVQLEWDQTVALDVIPVLIQPVVFSRTFLVSVRQGCVCNLSNSEMEVAS